METQPKNDLPTNAVTDAVANASTEMSAEEGRTPPENFSFSRMVLLLSIPSLVLVIFLTFKVLTDPLNFYWLLSAEPPAIPAYGLEQPLTVAEINAQLKDSDRILGQKLEFAKDEKRGRSPDAVVAYPVLDTVGKEIKEVRIYQAIANSSKLQLLSKTEVTGPDDWYVLAPSWKYNPSEKGKTKLKGDRYPLRQIQAIPGTAPKHGAWFVASGSKGKTQYGVVLAYISQPRPSLFTLSEWTSPNGKLPEWQNLLSASEQWAMGRRADETTANPVQAIAKEPQLVVDQRQGFEPDLQIFQAELVANPLQPLDLRQITLNEGLGMPRQYSESLLLASAGLWSPALSKLEEAKTELQGKQKVISAYVREQYALIAAHAQQTAIQADQPNPNPGRQALLLMIDGRWQEAIAVAEASESNAKSVLEALKPFPQHILARIKVLQKLKDSSLDSAISCGAIAVMAEKGLQEAKKWLSDQGNMAKEAIVLLDKLDVQPFTLKPEQILGTVTAISNRDPGGGWLIPPDPLPITENWYAVDITIMRDSDVWKTGVFTELIGRSPTAVWKLLGFNRNDTLALSTLDEYGLTTTSFLRVHSFALQSQGQLRLLVAGSPDLAATLKKSDIPAIASSNGSLPATTGTPTTPISLPAIVLERMTNALYQELQSLGEVSLKPEDFRRQLSSWTLKGIDLDGNGKVDYVLELDRLKIDMGDRRYPVIVAFDGDGNIIYSDIAKNSGRRWVTILPGKGGGQILTEIEGRYEVWALR